MNYEPNTTRWNIGDYVIHDADAKEPHMLMRVVGYANDGQVKTRYAFPAPWMDKRSKHRVWRNDLRYLLDPVRFGIDAQEYLRERRDVEGFFAKLDGVR